jgi:hypothetical protein
MSQAKASFEAALRDVTNLLQFHEVVGGQGPGRRPDTLGSLNKSGIVLLCATWESYIEFVIIECAEQHIAAARRPGDMRKSLSKLVASVVRNEKDDRAWQKVAGNGWREVGLSAVKEKVGALNTPKSKNISNLFHDLLDVQDIESNWQWHRSVLGVAKTRLDDFVGLRGSIAHGERRNENITKVQVTQAQDLITRLVEKVEERLTTENLLPTTAISNINAPTT